MFNVGDKVVYPMHGAGIIEAIEEKEILGESRKYYVMRMPIGNMKVMIPLTGVKNIGLRQVVDENMIDQVINLFQDEEPVITTNWNRRYRANMEKMKSGELLEVADVVRNLMLRDRDKGLSTGERKMLDNAKQILVSEMVLAKGIDQDQINSLLDDLIGERNASL
ncbi:CarD family transcriptional regulator [Microaerobacter geothermalis]|nr:CarD family transcriptional regulator [Microaerobacter geothermalis]